MFNRLRKSIGKGKEPMSSSTSQPKKKTRKLIMSSDSEEEQMEIELEEEEEEEQIPKPKWTRNRLLSDLHEVWQEDLYKEKMEKLKDSESIYVCERAVKIAEFAALGVVACFERLGWEAALRFHDPEQGDRIPSRAILNWMATLERHMGDNPPRTMSLRGKVGKKEVIMSFDTIRQVAPFDSRPDSEYVFPPENELFDKSLAGVDKYALLQELFRQGAERDLERKDLNILPKLLSIIAGLNVIPRLGDKMKVRHYELRILHALFTGRTILSFRHIAMLNVWESRVSYDRKMIPHCRLITALMRLQGALSSSTYCIRKFHKYLVLDKFSRIDWEFTRSGRRLTLRDKKTNQVLRGVTQGDAPLSEEEEEPVREEGNDEDEGEEEAAGGLGRSGRSGGNSSGRGYDEDVMEAIVRSSQPPEYAHWPRMQQLNWDRTTRQNEEDRRYRASMMYAQEQEINNRFHYSEEVRHYHDHHHGVPYSAHPPPTDWSSVLPYVEGDPYQRYPQSHHSAWIPPYPSAGGNSQGPSSAGQTGAFDMGDMHQGLYRSIFGDPLPQQPYDTRASARWPYVEDDDEDDEDDDEDDEDDDEEDDP